MCCWPEGLLSPSLMGERGLPPSAEACESVEAAKDDVAGDEASRLELRSKVAELGGSACVGALGMLGEVEVRICKAGRVWTTGYAGEAGGYDELSAGPGEGIVGVGGSVRRGIRCVAGT